jgi:SpoVK/Ycf46/Vps4 family AAA+-type ATPase
MVATTAAGSGLRGLLAELSWLDDLLTQAIARQRARPSDEFRGIYISEAEVDELLDLDPLGEEADFDDVLEGARLGGSALEDLAQRLNLSPFERATLLLAVAPYLDKRYGRLYAYLQDDLTLPFATPGLALELFCPSFQQRARERIAFSPEGRLRALRVLDLGGDESQRLLSRPLVVPERVVRHLLGSGTPEAEPGHEDERCLILPCDDEAALQSLRLRWAGDTAGTVLCITGEAGSGRRLAADEIAEAAGLQVHHAPAAGAVDEDVREALLLDRVLCLSDADALLQPNEDAAGGREAIDAALRAGPLRVILTLEAPSNAPASFGGRPVRVLKMPPLSTDARTAIWLQECRFAGLELTEDQAALLATTYRLSGAQIREAVERAFLVEGGSEHPFERMLDAARSLSTVTLGRLGSEIAPRFTWSDIVLPPEVEEALREITLRVRHQGKVFGDWGFDRRHASSRSLSVLFSGPSGTGKTMAAEISANELGLPLYRVDLAAVVSKYIGETEKNLAQIFGDAASSGAILFFDEADALFGRRSEVRDSHDRYANLEVSFLLQRMEDYDGIVILATNLRQNMDEAFVRRLHLAVDFPFPTAESRLEIWRRTLPPRTPLALDVDLEGLARRFRISGGHIRNACVTAAFLAASEDEPVAMRHLLAAVRREHQKMGKLLIDADEDAAPANGHKAPVRARSKP